MNKYEYKSNRLGEINYNNQGCKMKIIEYNNARNICVKFEKNSNCHKQYTTKTTYKAFKIGEVLNPYCYSVYGFGYRGCIKVENKKFYSIWSKMLQRCYSDKYKNRFKTYENVSCCEEWLNYSVFEKWCYDNYYELEGERTELDKDILVKGNKIYSPETCIFVPRKINTCFVSQNLIKDNGLPCGITVDSKNVYNAQCNTQNGRVYKYSKDLNKVLNFYKIEKEQEVKLLAEIYKNVIPIRLYNALYLWKYTPYLN